MVKRHQKGADGVYHVNGQKFSVLIGTRAMVFHGTAYKTAGGLKKCDLIQNNKTGRIVSKLKSIVKYNHFRPLAQQLIGIGE